MAINPTHIKYIKWRSPEGLHEDTIQCISQLQFINDEVNFLNELIKVHTLDLISGTTFEKSSVIVSKLITLQKEFKPLIEQVELHRNKLQTLMDDIDVPDEQEDYKAEHYKLMFESIGFNSKFKKLKKEIFSLISSILKFNKQKRLLN